MSKNSDELYKQYGEAMIKLEYYTQLTKQIKQNIANILLKEEKKEDKEK